MRIINGKGEKELELVPDPSVLSSVMVSGIMI